MRNQRYFQIGAIVALATATGLVLSGSDLAQAVFSGAPADEELRVLAIEPVAGPDSQAAPAPSGLMPRFRTSPAPRPPPTPMP